MSRVSVRLARELGMLANDPAPGISAWSIGDDMTNLEAMILGPDDSPYKGGSFLLKIQVPLRYPLEPPHVRFMTPIYHPNIDSEGRICLDTLKMPPQGTWTPSVNINTLLLTLRLLLSNPNADDGLVPEITEQYRKDRVAFAKIAKDMTARFATGAGAGTGAGSTIASSSSSAKGGASTGTPATQGGTGQQELNPLAERVVSSSDSDSDDSSDGDSDSDKDSDSDSDSDNDNDNDGGEGGAGKATTTLKRSIDQAQEVSRKM